MNPVFEKVSGSMHFLMPTGQGQDKSRAYTGKSEMKKEINAMPRDARAASHSTHSTHLHTDSHLKSVLHSHSMCLHAFGR